MSFRVRPAGSDDFPAIYELSKLTGGGFTNLPPDKQTLIEKIERSEESFAREQHPQPAAATCSSGNIVRGSAHQFSPSCAG